MEPCEIVYQNLTEKTAADTFELFGTYWGCFPFTFGINLKLADNTHMLLRQRAGSKERGDRDICQLWQRYVSRHRRDTSSCARGHVM